MNIIKAIQAAELKKKERGYEFIYWCIDVHGVILTPTYDLYNRNAQYYTYALETLKVISDDPANKIIIWTSSHEGAAHSVIDGLKDHDIHVRYLNCNKDYDKTDLCDFTYKFYFDILLDDKAGFEAETDWKVIYNYLLAT